MIDLLGAVQTNSALEEQGTTEQRADFASVPSPGSNASALTIEAGKRIFRHGPTTHLTIARHVSDSPQFVHASRAIAISPIAQ